MREGRVKIVCALMAAFTDIQPGMAALVRADNHRAKEIAPWWSRSPPHFVGRLSGAPERGWLVRLHLRMPQLRIGARKKLAGTCIDFDLLACLDVLGHLNGESSFQFRRLGARRSRIATDGWITLRDVEFNRSG